MGTIRCDLIGLKCLSQMCEPVSHISFSSQIDLLSLMVFGTLSLFQRGVDSTYDEAVELYLCMLTSASPFPSVTSVRTVRVDRATGVQTAHTHDTHRHTLATCAHTEAHAMKAQRCRHTNTHSTHRNLREELFRGTEV